MPNTGGLLMRRTPELRWAVQDVEGDEVGRFRNRQEADKFVEEVGITDMRVVEIDRERLQRAPGQRRILIESTELMGHCNPPSSSSRSPLASLRSAESSPSVNQL